MRFPLNLVCVKSAEMDAPDLQTILSNLARLSNTTPPAKNPSKDETNVLTPAPPPIHGGNEPGLRSLADRTDDPRLRPQSRSTATASPKPVIDPATITTWQEGLRCVIKIAAQNAQFAVSIRKVSRLVRIAAGSLTNSQMIEDQRRHELRWYSERQNLKHTQAKRASSSAQAQSILQSLSTNSTFDQSDQPDNAADNDQELAAFDRKIYDAQQSLESNMVAELKGLGVPFFGTNRNLVVADGVEDQADPATAMRPKWSPLVTETQLLELRRRMVQHLEDMYKD